MKKSEIKELMKEAVKESLNESFVANIIEVVIRTTEKTIERKLDESVRKTLRKAIITETKKVSKTKSGTGKSIPKNRATKQAAKQARPVKLSKDPIINKMLKQTMETTTEGELSEFGLQTPDLSILGETYKRQLAGVNNQSLNENVQIPISPLSEDLGGDTLQGSVLDNSAIADVFKKDYRSTLKKMEENSGRGLPEAVQFYKEDKK